MTELTYKLIIIINKGVFMSINLPGSEYNIDTSNLPDPTWIMNRANYTQAGRYSVVDSKDNCFKRFAGGIADIIIAIGRAAISPLTMLTSSKRALFDVISLPVVIIRSLAMLPGSSKVQDCFNDFQSGLAKHCTDISYGAKNKTDRTASY